MAASNSATIKVVGTGEAYQDESVSETELLQVQERYGEERAKRLRDDGNSQFIDVSLSDEFRHFHEDIWVNKDNIKDIRSMFPDNQCEVLVLGAGLGGLLFAIRLIQAGIHPEDLRIVDTAGGFGGTWYWNRYPGLACDIESYLYLPLLEETGYIPKHRYAQGDEIRRYAELLADKYGIADSAVFQSKVQRLTWDEETKAWKIEVTQHRTGEQPQTLTVRSTFVVTTCGILNWPKLPGVHGIRDYRGQMFHTARWNYSFTGGSPNDPTLSRLKGKTVAIIGTGCTAVQAVPHLARFAEHLYVVQRTASSVDERHQHATDPEWFRKNVATVPGWQRERMRNFHQQFTTGERPAKDLVGDAWTGALGIVTALGNPDGPKSTRQLPPYLKKLHSLDLIRQNRIRERTRTIVKNKGTANKLQAWYPTWCKRPAFSDEYLETFNRHNVTLLDTDGKGITALTANSIEVNGEKHAVDAIIFATGFRSPLAATPAEKANAAIIGRNGVSLTEAWAKNGPTTLHGIFDHNFPNLFFAGPLQAALSPNNLHSIDVLARNAAFVLGQAKRRAADGKPLTVASTPKATHDWSMQILSRSFPSAAAAGCTPGYGNREGEFDRIPEELRTQLAKSGLWGLGMEDFEQHLQAWRAEGNLKGIEINA